jgi:gliding motility-associated-like protein
MKFFSLICCLFITIKISAQIDKTFWFAAPDIDVANYPQNGPYDRPIYLRLTTLSSAANVTISIPANASFAPINIAISANSTSTVNLTAWVNLIENFDANTIKNKGILIQSTADITAYYEINSNTCGCNPELFALKGKNAIGNEFYIPSQQQWAIDTIRFPSAKAAFEIVATENNTIVTITPSKNLIGRNANIPFTITLNKGETFSNQGLFRNGPNLLNGSKVVSNKPIAVTTKEDLLFTDGPCADLAGDQLVPTSIMGKEFGVVRGNLSVRDKVVVTATQNSTNIFLNGGGTSVASISAGQSHEIDLTSQASVYITTNNAVNVLHYTGETCEVGAAIIPKLNCTGSSSVSIVRSNSGSGVVLIITKNGNQGGFLVNGNAGAITSADFTPLPGTGGNYVYCKKDITSFMPLNLASNISNSIGKFQLGFINGISGGGSMYGYFSDFKKSNVSSTQVEVCRLDSIQLNAFGGSAYQWTPSAGLSNANISNPKTSPNVTTDYKVVITDIDGCIDSAFVKVVVNNCTAIGCNNWLKLPTVPSSVKVGDLDISGNQITVEATFNRDAFFTPVGFSSLDIVSKHNDPSDVNYLLRPNFAEITTTNGFFRTPTVCETELHKTYHVAMVYNGSTLKFYRNGFLMKQIAATGNLVLNNWQTCIGLYDPQITNTNFLGYINEVRIWDIARTQTELRTYMNSSLPNPTTQTGLKGYYTFDNLLNKQGNTAFNGTLNGGATINATNPNCTFVADSCNIVTPQETIINDYTPILALDPCKNTLTVGNTAAYNVGDTVLMIQMKGAIIDSTNTAAFGNITDYKSAGNYEYNYVKSKTGNQIELKNKILRTYEIPNGKVQLIRVPYYQNYTTTNKLTCLPWDGSIGGVLVFNVANTLTLNNDIDVSGKGFKGGIDPVTNPPIFNCGENQIYYPQNPDLASGKGEGIAVISVAKSFGKGALANGGGGGNSHNSAGGGGSNGAVGGLGGYQFEGSPCTGQSIDSRGIGGKLLTYNNAANKIFLGGGGGAGHSNNFGNFQALGGNGSGIIIISASSLQSNNNKILANGAVGVPCGNSGSGCHEGMGGGGAGGSTLLNITTYLDNISCETIGGKGGDMQSSGNLRVGPGGGGGGGILWLKQSALPTSITSLNSGGLNGVCTAYSNDPWGATPGQPGQTLFNLNLPITTIPFNPNIDSTRFNSNLVSCKKFDFNGFGYINTNPIVNWQWTFGDGTIGAGQNLSHFYANAGPYTVKLVATDANGCKDSISKNIIVTDLTTTISTNVTICHNRSTQLNVVGGTTHTWSPTTYLNNPNIPNPIATPVGNIKYYVTSTDNNSCSKRDSVSITIIPKPTFGLQVDKESICFKDSVQFFATGGDKYTWVSSGFLNNTTIPNPFGKPNSTANYNVEIISSTCKDTAQFSKLITVSPLPILNVSKSNDINCNLLSAQLNASGASNYIWSPINGLSDPYINNPKVNGDTTITYVVKGDDGLCSDTTSVIVYVTKDGQSLFFVPNIFTPNNDGKNDCFSIRHWGNIKLKEFSVYTRWGQKIFSTTNSNHCWDGTFKGQVQPTGAYVYQIRASSFCGDVYRKGTIMLTR